MNKRDFQALIGINHDENPIFEEDGWFIDSTESFLGVVFRDRVDDDWAYSIQARDPYGRFRSIIVDSGMATRAESRDGMYVRMVALLAKPQRYFIQD